MLDDVGYEDVMYTRMALFSWDCKEAPSRINHDNIKFFISNLKNWFKDNEKRERYIKPRYILINFNQIEDTDDHIYRDLVYCALEQGLKVFCFVTNRDIKEPKPFKHIVNSSKEFCKESEQICFNMNKNNKIEYVSINMTLSEIDSIVKSDDLFDRVAMFENTLIDELVSNSFIKYDFKKILSSTPVLAPGEFNASKILSEPLSFKWLVLLMVDLIVYNTEKKSNQNITIIASSLRGSALAISVWEVLQDYFGVDIYIIDHLGPNYDITESVDIKIKSNHKVIYIGDFLIAGTELKTTDMYCNNYGGKISSAFVIGKYTDNNIFMDRIELYSLTNLKNCVDELKYELS